MRDDHTLQRRTNAVFRPEPGAVDDALELLDAAAVAGRDGESDRRADQLRERLSRCSMSSGLRARVAERGVNQG